MSNKAVYGKALGAFRRINNVKSSLMNVEEQRVNLAKKQAIAKDNAQRLLFEKEFQSKAINTAGSAIGAGLQYSNKVNPETVKNWTPALTLGSELMSDLSLGRISNNDMKFLSSQDLSLYQKQDNLSNLATNAIDQFSFQESIDQIRKKSSFKKEIDKIIKENPKLEYVKDMNSYAKDNMEWKKNKGYTVDQLETLKDYATERKRQGLLPDNVDIKKDNIEELVKLLNSIKMNKNYL